MSEIALALRRQQVRHNEQGMAEWETTIEERQWQGDRTALILCDVWDNHWSRGAALRVNVMVPALNAAVQNARSRGVTIVHAPSDVISFYASDSARIRIASLEHTSPPADLQVEDPPLPIDDSDGGSDTGETSWYSAWSRQHPGIFIDQEKDVISDSGVEIWSYLKHVGVEHVLIAGVHTNMCVLHRSFGIKQMVRWGVDIALLRDFTDTMYNPLRRPYTSHAEGTRLVVEFIEKFWCPTTDGAILKA